MAERAVKTVKQMLEKNDDPYLAYRSTPLENGYSPSELLMGRKIRTTLPMMADQLKPCLPNQSKLRKKEEKMRARMKQNYDNRHNAKELKPLNPGDTVWIPERDASGTVVTQESRPRSYTVREKEGGTLQRNRRHLVLMPRPESSEMRESTETEPPVEKGKPSNKRKSSSYSEWQSIAATSKVYVNTN